MRDVLGEVFIEVEGTDLSTINNEAGGHRIQRIPPTEKKGRVHTSTITVAVIDPTIQKLEYKESDTRIEWYSGTGNGGSNRNKKQCSCRITHIQSGLVSTAQTRSRQTSFDEAQSSLIESLKKKNYIEKKTLIDADRKQQVGSGMRGDKIRTIRFRDNIVSDHITGKKMAADRYMKGYIDELWN